MESPRPSCVLTKLSGFLLGLTLFVAPLAWGCSRPIPMGCLSIALHGIGLLWVAGLLLERRELKVPPLVLICSLGFLAYAWLRYFLIPPALVDSFTIWHQTKIFDRWPESMMERSAFNITSLFSGAVTALIVACDLGQRWRKAFIYSMTASGICVVLLGLLQNYTQAPGIYWQTPKNSMPSVFFGPFYHFTSAGAFINLTWPIAGSLALFYFSRYLVAHKPLLPALMWGLTTEILLLGHAGHVSRVPQVIALVIIILLFFIHRLPMRFRFNHAKAVAMLLVGAVSLLGAWWVVSQTGRLTALSSRWKQFEVGLPPLNSNNKPEADVPHDPKQWPALIRDDLFLNSDHSGYFLHDRGAAYMLAAECIAKRPFFGYGAGGWTAAASQNSTDPLLRTFFHYTQFTHEDYLQTVVEWGLFGGLLLFVLIFGALKLAADKVDRQWKSSLPRTHSQAVAIGLLAAALAALAQSLYDFPLQIPANLFYVFVIAGMLWSCTDTTPNPSDNN